MDDVKQMFDKIWGARQTLQVAEAAAEEARRAVARERTNLQAAFREALKDGLIVGDRAYQIGNQVYILQRRKVSHDTGEGWDDGLTHDLLILPVSKLSRRQQVS